MSAIYLISDELTVHICINAYMELRAPHCSKIYNGTLESELEEISEIMKEYKLETLLPPKVPIFKSFIVENNFPILT